MRPLATTQWTARRLGFQPQLGLSWFEFARAGVHVPLASFWWWCHDDACTPTIFIEGTAIATSGGFALIGIAIGVLVWRAPEDGPVFLDRDLGPIFWPYGVARRSTTRSKFAVSREARGGNTPSLRTRQLDGRRVLLGGVTVAGPLDLPHATPLPLGATLRTAVEALGAQCANDAASGWPCIFIGGSPQPRGAGAQIARRCPSAPTRTANGANRWLIVLMVLCCGPLAIALTAAASARR